jgi:hypothetical protein
MTRESLGDDSLKKQSRPKEIYTTRTAIRSLNLNEQLSLNEYPVRKLSLPNAAMPSSKVTSNNATAKKSFNLKRALKLIINSSFFNFFSIIILSIFVNSIYFNLYYLPRLSVNQNQDHTTQITNQKKISTDKLDTKTKNQLKLLDNLNLITSQHNDERPSNEDTEKFIINSYDHVVFPPIKGQDDKTASASSDSFSNEQNTEDYKQEDSGSKSIIDINNYLFDKIDDESLKQGRFKSVGLIKKLFFNFVST